MRCVGYLLEALVDGIRELYRDGLIRHYFVLRCLVLGGLYIDTRTEAIDSLAFSDGTYPEETYGKARNSLRWWSRQKPGEAILIGAQKHHGWACRHPLRECGDLLYRFLS